MKIILRVIASISLLLLASFASRAELVNFEIVEIESPTFDGRSHLVNLTECVLSYIAENAAYSSYLRQYSYVIIF